MNIPSISLPSIATITQTIAVLPEIARNTINFWAITYPITMSRISGEPLDFLTDEDDEAEYNKPLMPWQAGRIALEITMLIRGHKEFHEGHHEAMDRAVDDINTPQHAIDVVMALGSMLAHVLDEDQIAAFGQSLTEAEARAS